nr:hypothetical protein Iba_chr05bCG7030 [Ipomoea batatas]
MLFGGPFADKSRNVMPVGNWPSRWEKAVFSMSLYRRVMSPIYVPFATLKSYPDTRHGPATSFHGLKFPERDVEGVVLEWYETRGRDELNVKQPEENSHQDRRKAEMDPADRKVNLSLKVMRKFQRWTMDDYYRRLKGRIGSGGRDRNKVLRILGRMAGTEVRLVKGDGTGKCEVVELSEKLTRVRPTEVTDRAKTGEIRQCVPQRLLGVQDFGGKELRHCGEQRQETPDSLTRCHCGEGLKLMVARTFVVNDKIESRDYGSPTESYGRNTQKCQTIEEERRCGTRCDHDMDEECKPSGKREAGNRDRSCSRIDLCPPNLELLRNHIYQGSYGPLNQRANGDKRLNRMCGWTKESKLGLRIKQATHYPQTVTRKEGMPTEDDTGMPHTDTARETEVALEDDIAYDFWSEAVDVAAMFNLNPEVEVGVQQEEITITQPQMDFDNTQSHIGQQVTKSAPKLLVLCYGLTLLAFGAL